MPSEQQTYIVDGIVLAPGDVICRFTPPAGLSWFADRQFGCYILTAAMLEAMPVVNLNDQLSTLPGFYQRRAGGELNVTGAREEGSLYIIDGIQIH